jgi:hypothetical protein
MRSEDTHFKTKVFRKATNTDKILDFSSNHPLEHKRSCVKALFARINTHCTTEEIKIAEREYLIKQFKANGYPIKFINSCLRTKPILLNNSTVQQKWVTLPYIQNVSEAASRLFKEANLKVAHKPVKYLGSHLSRLKDPVDTMEKNNVIYSVPCLNCEKRYIGETGKMLKNRLHEHFLAIRRGDNLSQIWNHCSQYGHEVSLKDTTVLARGGTKNERLFLEAIFSDEKSYNRHVDVDGQLATVARNSNRTRKKEIDNLSSRRSG